MKSRILAFLFAGFLIAAGSARAQSPDAAPAAAPVPATPVGATHRLEADDVNAWLDGFMPLALADGNIAGAVVVVVKDGRVLTQRGFGVSDVATRAPVDPARTLFRTGSTSKLFTWTAVMQLVEVGKISLDADINTYLDFTIPAAFGKPITMRNLMTHTGGFEEHAKHLFVPGISDLKPIGDYLKDWIPARIFPPGEVPAYSNYGAALAGYIVERVSGEQFDAYIAHHIFQPLGMQDATFDQPLPTAWIPNLSKSYMQASQPAHAFELIPASPAGALSITGADIARFMIAHIDNGRFGETRILKPETAILMHAQAFAATPLPGMALGFYHEDRNGHVIVGHAGDTETFHTDLHLFLDDATGLFVSFNSLGADGGAHTARTLLFHEFTDRYFPAPAVTLPTLATAAKDATIVAGSYVASRRSATTFLHLTNLIGLTTIAADADGTITFSDIKLPGGDLVHWREIAPFVWQKVGGVDRLAAVVKDGRVTAFGMEGAPFEVFLPATGAYAAWNMVLLEACLAVLATAALLWPVTALVRRRYSRSFSLAGRPALFYRLVRAAAVVDVALAIGWVTIFSLLEKDVTLLNDPINPWLRILQVLGWIGIAGALAGVLNLAEAFRSAQRSWSSKLTATALALATIGAAWIIIGQQLASPGLEF